MIMNICLMPSCTSPISVPDRALAAEGDLAGRGDLEAHLLLDVGDEDAVALAELAGVQVHVVLRDQEHRQALGADAVPLGAGQHQVEDVVGQVVLGAGDEALHALDVPGAVVLPYGLRAAGAHVGAGVRLGEHHGGAPLVLDGQLGEALLVLGADRVEDVGEGRAAGVHPHGRVGAEHQLGQGPAHAARQAGAAHLGGKAEVGPARVTVGGEGPLEALRHRHRRGGGVEHRRGAVALLEGVGEHARGEPVDLLQDASHDVLVQIGVKAGTQDVPAPEDLEEVELQVTDIALVVAHGVCSLKPGVRDCPYSPVTLPVMLPASNP